MASAEYFDADELLASGEIEGDVVRHTNSAALELSILQPDVQGIRFVVVANLHC